MYDSTRELMKSAADEALRLNLRNVFMTLNSNVSLAEPNGLDDCKAQCQKGVVNALLTYEISLAIISEQK